GADVLDHGEVGALALAAEIIAFAWPAALGERDQAGRMILDVEPVAHVRAVAVDRQRLAGDRLENGERNELFRELARPVVVRAIRSDDRPPMRAGPRLGQMGGPRLARRIGRAWPVRRVLVDPAVGPERAVDFVGRHVDEAKTVAPRRREGGP